MPKIIQCTLDFERPIEEHLNKSCPGYVDYRILAESLDARKINRGGRPLINYRIEVIFQGESFSQFSEEFHQIEPLKSKPIIIGSGPAGLFCALRFSEYAQPCIIIERGDRANRRMLKISKFWRYGELDEENNVCFGEGGAGLFSDGKLITRVKSKFVGYVMQKFVDFGAPKETAYVSNPHLGSNKIRGLITKMSEFLTSKGCEFHYNTRVDKILFKNNKVIGVELSNGQKLYSDHVILATGHSAKDIYFHLKDENVKMKHKDFAVGVRVEHPRKLIDSIQHGKFAGHEKLGSARYRISYNNNDTHKGTYSFCMCPGGHVLSSGTEKDGIVTNGMSNFSRNSPWSNAALIVSVKAGEDFTIDDILSGHKFQRNIEKKAYEYSKINATGRELPAQGLRDFLDGKKSKKLVKSSTPSGTVGCDMNDILPHFINEHLHTALTSFNKSMNGFISNEALFIAPETRTSAPVTIERDRELMNSVSHSGLYPCGEGAGYAGGITSAAVDGVKAAMAILKLENRV